MSLSVGSVTVNPSTGAYSGSGIALQLFELALEDEPDPNTLPADKYDGAYFHYAYFVLHPTDGLAAQAALAAMSGNPTEQASARAWFLANVWAPLVESLIKANRVRQASRWTAFAAALVDIIQSASVTVTVAANALDSGIPSVSRSLSGTIE
ncbi:MAG: hypothetical protein U0271_34205 [Polyangiaceae bacterium]